MPASFMIAAMRPIAKALLLQMPNVSFTQYRNELARVLGTRQQPSKSVSTKSVSATQEGTESGEEEKSIPKIPA